MFLHAVSAVHPAQLIRSNISVRNNSIFISGNEYVLPADGKIYVIGAGKAAAAMALETEKILTPHYPLQGFVVTKYGHTLPLAHIGLLEAGHPVPDENSVSAAVRLTEIAQQAQSNDLVIFLLSGGASALVADFPPGSSLEEVQQLFTLLLRSGADIGEMNTVRKHLSGFKGGQLAEKVYPATLYTLILSDVVGDDLSVIGSGPTVPDPSTFADTLNILRKYHLTEKIPGTLLQYILDGVDGKIPDTPKPGSSHTTHVHNHLAGTNLIALQAAAEKAAQLGYHPQILSAATTGDAHTIAEMLVSKALTYTDLWPGCLLLGGETTVNVTGDGLGGRNQQLALAAGIALAGHKGITILSGGTDGTDGPTDAAGAIADANVMEHAAKLHINANYFLHNNDAYHFFSKAGGLLVTGPTQTNVMDLMIVLIA
ncbi:MAG TPA: DUF4147 domain-containing protein [Chitinophaga sp.]|uniref:glycerate kinase type-2 family protein n=1 Tax=Chitinophaga sp. TaxID=1869181 RepID=UPI002C7217C9|nr:DUF4147 domain-containing protein [Chitinophaga sp.]HVI43390.1 DUF4147 domain-containing protein [Chitinophaga sp.]